MMSIVKNEFENVISGVKDSAMQSFFGAVSEAVQEYYSKDKSLEKAQEGTVNELINEQLNMMTKEFHEDTRQMPLYTETELENMFERYYREYIETKRYTYEAEINREELIQRFKIYVREYTKHLEKTLSVGEKRILERTEQISNEMQGILSKEYFELRSKESTELLKQLCKDQNKPFIHITDCQPIVINHFDAKYAFLQNTYDFTEIPAYDKDNYNLFVITFSLKNAGKTFIEEIELSDIQMCYYKEVDGGITEEDYYVLPFTSYPRAVVRNTVNLIPGCDQKVHIIFEQNAEELEDETFNHFFKFYDYDKVQFWFTLTAKGEKETLVYDIVMFMSRNVSSEQEEDIVGTWRIDYVWISLKETE